MGTDLMAYKKPNIQVGTREEDTIEKEYVGSYQIWSNWINADIHTWPECLQNFWWKIHDYDSAHTCATNIRKYYPVDKELIPFACWLEKMNTDIIFELSI